MFVWLIAQGLTASPSQAYAYNGCRHGGVTVSWKYTSGSPSSYNTLILDAANSWNPDDVNMVRTTSSAPEITVGAFNYGNVSWSGHTYWTCVGGFFNHPVVIDVNRYYTDHYVSQMTQGTIAHEFGHSLGLAHYSSSTSPCNKMTIMVPDDDSRWGTCRIVTPTPDDQNGINHLY